jgi:hypothetical protein
MRQVLFFLLLLFSAGLSLVAQPPGVKSIHHEELEKFRNLGNPEQFYAEPIDEFQTEQIQLSSEKTYLTRKVFGYHPYWGGNNYLNYQWDLLSDLCYFSYEVDPATGEPLTVHDWETSPAIDLALANNVKVHLCVTLFSSHGTFFNNPEAKENLVENVISLVQQRQAHGVNLDFEAVPSAYSDALTEFIQFFYEQVQQNAPGIEISIAAPAVNWSNTFDIPVLKSFIDFFMVMCYDYYWNGSSQAGPVSPLYAMVDYYNYSLSKTISYYQSQSVEPEKIIVGVPYYARQWPTEGQYAPSATTGSGIAYTYSNIRNNVSGNYSLENKMWEPNSFAPYYAFFNSQWNQCFIDDVYSMGIKYNIVNRRNLGGIGIWALGYDDGYSDMWNLIQEKFSSAGTFVLADTIFDSGGPSHDYYNDEFYPYTLTVPENANIFLSFSYLNLETGYDSLWIYDGPDEASPLLGVFSGDTTPTLIHSSGNALTLKFYSDAGITATGWRAVFDTMPVSGLADQPKFSELELWPNPATENVFIRLPNEKINTGKPIIGKISSIAGQTIQVFEIFTEENSINLNVSGWEKGVYILELSSSSSHFYRAKLIVN